MKALGNLVAYCVKEKKPCVWWVEKYFMDCLCNLNDELSFGFGMVSLVCWGVAEIPQIITNFRTKSSHGVSLLFLLTWIAGDIFNLVGCLLEPATLPTQYYTALLYTASTVVLVLQTIYYDHFYSWWKCRQIRHSQQRVEEEKEPSKSPKPADESGIPIPGGPIAQSHRKFYYTSARSLAGSSTPPTWSYLRAARSGPSAMGYTDDHSSDDDVSFLSSSNISVTQPKPIPRPEESMENNVYGQWLGWMMAAIYMGGRIPQIWLNIKRGSVEGLNPLMFFFALVANAAYVASILVRTSEWDKIKANMPWLLDAVVCVLLDLFIILQYIYYRYMRKRSTSGRKDHGDYMEANKALLS
ncbi:probable vacuolar amino acid transporter YPQ1 isoform X4 [Camellia sinensis]|uniref:probable vacuolar amino acid transporter YPQ1 isoform X4 n=1 Tax=Camellia sinensis TaxID=4442 RepID=UPI001036EF2E|nr:probable vacuolar amino acid transporter YPQ1 isoform X4 [Camellia sinensis]